MSSTRVRTLFALSIAATALVLWFASSSARAQDAGPTRTMATNLGLVTDQVSGLVGANPNITWSIGERIDHYHLIGSLTAIRVNKSDLFCTPPIQTGSRTISLDETISGSSNQFLVIFPQVPEGDGWFVSLSEIRLDALNDQGLNVGTQGGGGTADATCARAAVSPTASPKPQLPSTGQGRRLPANDGGLVALFAAGLLVILAGVVLSANAR